MKVSPYWKTIVAILGAAAYTAQAAITDSTITPDEWVNIGIAVLVAAGVYTVPNRQAPAASDEVPGYRR